MKNLPKIRKNSGTRGKKSEEKKKKIRQKGTKSGKRGKSGRKGQSREGSFTLPVLTEKAGYATERCSVSTDTLGKEYTPLIRFASGLPVQVYH